MDRLWDQSKILIFLSVLTSFTVLVCINKMETATFVGVIVALLTPSAYPFGRKPTGATITPPPVKP